mmetsp:Transcript_11551/g.37950  ORF Transcript_11551/g.37950 Transcript_11551/m.37950 type:complete len:208 (+) Transcript_11551:2753-3376(+)
MPVPRALSGETGFLKTMMEATMTTTLLTHFPTLWLTVETRSSTMYDTCWYAWKHRPAKSALYAIAPTSKPYEVSAAGASWTPSKKKVMGAQMKRDMTVMMEKRLMLSSDDFTFPIIFFDNTLRLWKVRLLPMAAANPARLKEASVKLAMATPPTTGMSESTTSRLGTSPRKMLERMTEKKGSIALMVCVNETATLPSDTFVSRLPTV